MYQYNLVGCVDTFFYKYRSFEYVYYICFLVCLQPVVTPSVVSD